MSEKASVVLKAGRLVTGGSSSTCGVQLEPEVTYLITGKVLAGQAHVNLCNYITNWNDLTVRQKKGFRLLYRQGCLCEVRFLDGEVQEQKEISINYDTYATHPSTLIYTDFFMGLSTSVSYIDDEEKIYLPFLGGGGFPQLPNCYFMRHFPQI